MIATTLFPDGTPADLRAWGLVMPQAVRDSLIAKQDQAGLHLHRVTPVALSDGRWAVCADVLAEAHATGLFSRVDLLDPAAVALVQPLPWTEVLALLPVVDGEA